MAKIDRSDPTPNGQPAPNAKSPERRENDGARNQQLWNCSNKLGGSFRTTLRFKLPMG
jgi:hypothetical protein